MGGDITGLTDDSGVAALAADEAVSQGAPTSGAVSGDRWQRHAVCREWITVEMTGVMFGGVWDGAIPDCAGDVLLPAVPCADGEVALEPWWVSRTQGDGTYGPWSQVSSFQCTGDLIYAQVANAWETMPIVPNTYQVQPSTGYAIAELGVNLVVDMNPRTLGVTLMGTPVTIRAVPTQYSWSNTDGTAWTSTTAGKTYEQGGEPFTFPRTAEHRTTFTLTTTWRGEYSTNGGATWRDAPGTATTTSTSTSVHVYNPHTHLVDCDLNGNCINGSPGGGDQKTILDPDGDGIDNYLIPDNQIGDYLATRDADHTWTHTERKSSG